MTSRPAQLIPPVFGFSPCCQDRVLAAILKNLLGTTAKTSQMVRARGLEPWAFFGRVFVC